MVPYSMEQHVRTVASPAPAGHHTNGVSDATRLQHDSHESRSTDGTKPPKPRSLDAGVAATPAEVAHRGFQGPAAMGPEEVLEVPPDGSCLFHCIVTCRDVARLRASIQDERGFMADRRCEANLQEASRRLRHICVEAAAEAGREDIVTMLRSSRLPEGGALRFLAQWLEGSVWVTLEGVSTEFDVLIGEGPIACRLLLCSIVDAEGQSSPHYRLAGSWVMQRQPQTTAEEPASGADVTPGDYGQQRD